MPNFALCYPCSPPCPEYSFRCVKTVKTPTNIVNKECCIYSVDAKAAGLWPNQICSYNTWLTDMSIFLLKANKWSWKPVQMEFWTLKVSNWLYEHLAECTLTVSENSEIQSKQYSIFLSAEKSIILPCFIMFLIVSPLVFKFIC